MTFRVKVRVKKYKMAPIADPIYPGLVPMFPAPLHITTKCPRCGINWGAGPMGYCCPHGTMCGVPVVQEPRWQGTGWISTPTTCGSGGIVTSHDPRLQLWN